MPSSKNFRHIVHGANLVPNSTTQVSVPGDMDYSTDTGQFNFYDSTGPVIYVTENGVQTLTNKTIDASLNTITNLSNSSISPTAGIAFSKLASLPSSDILVGSGSNIATAVSMSGDVTISNAGATTVGSVGGSSAANIHNAELAANAATNLDTNSTIVKRDGSGNFSATTITANLTGNASGTALNVTGIVLPANGGTGIANNNAATLTRVGNHAVTLTTTNTTSLTLPTTGTLSTLAGTETLTNKTISIANNTIGSGAASAGQVLTADGSGGTTFASSSASPTSSQELSNLGLSASYNGGTQAITFSLKQSDGSTDPSAGSPVKIGFRGTTAGNGNFSQILSTAATSITLATNSTLGLISGANQYIYIYAIDNAGTIELALSGNKIFDEGTRQTTTAINSPSSTSNYVLYSTTFRVNNPIRLIGRAKVNEVNIATWTMAPLELSVFPFQDVNPRSMIRLSGGNSYGGSSSGDSIIRNFTTVVASKGFDITYVPRTSTTADFFVINNDGVYSINRHDHGGTATYAGFSVNSNQTSTGLSSITNANRLMAIEPSVADITLSYTGLFNAGDIIRAHDNNNNYTGTADVDVIFVITKVSN